MSKKYRLENRVSWLMPNKKKHEKLLSIFETLLFYTYKSSSTHIKARYITIITYNVS